MPHHLAFIQKIAVNYLGFFDGSRRNGIVQPDLPRAFAAVSGGLFLVDRVVVDDDVIETNFRRVFFNRFQVTARRKTVRLAGLRHQIADENFYGFRFGNRAARAFDQNRRQKRSEKRAGSGSSRNRLICLPTFEMFVSP